MGWSDVGLNLSLCVSSGAVDGWQRSPSAVALRAVQEKRKTKNTRTKWNKTTPTTEEEEKTRDVEAQEKKTEHFCLFVGCGQVLLLSKRYLVRNVDEPLQNSAACGFKRKKDK